ncbi:FAD-binding protein [Salibacterium salarium]|uniref:FAD-binding protein n=2 Tax=Salibacterium salarium TaxID=284579 RepID=A0A428N510_9BACI|nr:FAD-binding protein [Salibacterium salarium]
MSENQHQVIVVGAGPVGMTAALSLQKRGISCVVLEAEAVDQPSPGSRAIFLHKASLSLLEQTAPGLGFTIARNGIVWPVKRTLYKGKEVYQRYYGETDTSDPVKLPPFTALHQNEIERYIYEECVNAGVEFVWETPVSECQTSKDGVTVISENGEKWEADYVIGADGGRSAVRKSSGIQFEGPRTADTFLVVDIEEDEQDPLPLERIFHYQHPAMNGRNVMHVPFKGGWRVDLQLLEDDDVEEFTSIEGVKTWLPKVMDEKYANRITWVSSYRFHQVVADSFTDENRRVLLAGEAAHLFAPFGARGLNSGVPDAIIATNGIEKAMNSDNEESRQEAIDASAKERRIAAKWNRNGSTTALHHLQGNAPEMNLKREVAASLTSIAPQLGRWLDEGPYGPKSGPPELTTKY